MVRWLGVAVVVVVVASGCASTKSLLVARFSKERACQKDAVFAHESSANVYVVEGCGKRIEYVCQSFAGDASSARNCAERGVNPNPSLLPPQRTAPVNQPEPPR